MPSRLFQRVASTEQLVLSQGELSLSSAELASHSEAAQSTPQPTPQSITQLRMLRGAIASPDIAVARGFVPFEGVVGHMGVGVVESSDFYAPGSRVTIFPHVVCGSCDLCRAGLSNHCPTREVMGLHKRDGVFATRITCPTQSLLQVPSALDDDRASLACLVASALATAGLVRVEGKPFVTVLGDGPLGLLVAQLLARRNASVRLLGTHASRMQTCEKWGVRHRHIAETGTHRDQHLVFDCTGSPLGTRLAMQMVRPRGTIVVKAWPLPVEASSVKHERLNLSVALSAEATIIGSGPGTLAHVEEALELLASRKLDVEPLITRRYALRQFDSAYTQAAMPESACILLDLQAA